MHNIQFTHRWRPPPRGSNRRSTARRILVTLVAAFAASGCDDSFSPIEPSALQFSIFGYLDVSADTQWIRVMPIRPLAVTEPVPSEATVTLEEVGSGHTIELRDSLFRFRAPNSEVGSEGIYLHNFWTAEPIEPGATYRLLARREGEAPSEAVVTVPPRYEVEVWLGQPRTNQRNLLRLGGLEHVGLLISEVRFYDQCGETVARHHWSIPPTHGDEQLIPIDGFSVFRGCGAPQIEEREIFIVGSGTEWPSGAEYSAGGLGVTDAPSNISNSIGFLGGVLTRRVPYENCLIETREPATEHCKLRYDEQSVTLAGVVMDATCDAGPVKGALVSLRELDPEDPGRRMVRIATTRRSGEFEIGALEGGKRYALSVTRFVSIDPYDQYREHRDTLQFTAGQRLTYDVDLEPFVCRP